MFSLVPERLSASQAATQKQRREAEREQGDEDDLKAGERMWRAAKELDAAEALAPLFDYVEACRAVIAAGPDKKVTTTQQRHLARLAADKARCPRGGSFPPRGVLRRPQYIASQVERQTQLVDGVAESLETLRLKVITDDHLVSATNAAAALRVAAEQSVRLEAPSDPMENAFGGDSDISLAQSEHDRLTGAAEAPAPQDEQVQDSDDAFGLFDDEQDDNYPFDDPFGLATAPSPVAAPVAEREGGQDLDRIFEGVFGAPGAGVPAALVAAPVPAAAAPAPAPPAALEDVAAALADLGVPIDRASVANSPVSRQLLRIAQAAAEAAQREVGGTRLGSWRDPEPQIADLLVDAFRRRRLPLTTGASVKTLLAEVLSCSEERIRRKYTGQRTLGRVSYQGQNASEDDLAALASELEAFVAQFATSLRERPASASVVSDAGYGVDGAPRRARSPAPGAGPRALMPPPPGAAPAAAAAPRAVRKPRAAPERITRAVVAASPGQNRSKSTTINRHALPPLNSFSAQAEPSYDSLINFPRIKGFCSMCGKPGGTGDGHVEIPTQNRDVCKVCDSTPWKHEASGAYFKWCKGCKRFHEIHAFAGKISASKCDVARARGRESQARCAAGAAAAPAPAATPAPGGAVAAAGAATPPPPGAPARRRARPGPRVAADPGNLETARALADGWRIEGSQYLGRTVRRTVLDAGGLVTSHSDGVIRGWLDASRTHYEDDNGEPAALWHVYMSSFPRVEIDLELHEVLDSLVPATPTADAVAATGAAAAQPVAVPAAAPVPAIVLAATPPLLPAPGAVAPAPAAAAQPVAALAAVDDDSDDNSITLDDMFQKSRKAMDLS